MTAIAAVIAVSPMAVAYETNEGEDIFIMSRKRDL
jgi:hypothetical protein